MQEIKNKESKTFTSEDQSEDPSNTGSRKDSRGETGDFGGCISYRTEAYPDIRDTSRSTENLA